MNRLLRRRKKIVENYEFLIKGKTHDKEKVLEICKSLDEAGICYDCLFEDKNPQETDKNPIRNPQEKRILAFCKEPKTLKEIVEYCGYKDVPNFREQYINPLLAERKLQMTVPESPNHRHQKYVDTSQKFFVKEGEN